MDADEREIYYYLRRRRTKSVPVREVSRHVGGRRKYRCAPDWAAPVLMRMAERGILEQDERGRYRLKPIPEQPNQARVWVSPKIAEALKRKGKWSHRIITVDDEFEYYDKL